jgi:hypothetical protein
LQRRRCSVDVRLHSGGPASAGNAGGGLSGGTLQRLTEQFILEGWLSPEQADDHGRVEKAIAFLLEQHAHVGG